MGCDDAGSATACEIKRLAAGLRALDESGIARLATAWTAHDLRARASLEDAHQVAVAMVQRSPQLLAALERARATLFAITDPVDARAPWSVVSGQRAQRAERAAFCAALGLLVRSELGSAEYGTLVAPLVEQLPWLSVPSWTGPMTPEINDAARPTASPVAI